MNTLLPIAQQYVELGFCVIPINWRSKKATLEGWPQLRLKPDDLPRYFDGRPLNIGVLLGEPSGGLVDVDLDSAEAVALGPTFLPATDAVFGRKSKLKSHWLYMVTPAATTSKFKDPARRGKEATILEIRSTGCQTVFPGSLHESGEHVCWEGDGGPYHPTPVTLAELTDAVRRVAAAAMLTAHWPSGSRHDAALALAGGLRRGGYSLTDATNLVIAVARVAGDPEAGDRVRAVADTYRATDNTTGWPSLAKMMPGSVVAQVRGLLIGAEAATAVSATPDHDPVSAAGAGTAWADTDLANANRLRHLYGETIRYDHTRQMWLLWDGSHWEGDRDGAVFRLAEAVSESIRHEATSATGAAQEILTKWAHKSQGRARQDALVYLARNLTGIAVTAEQLDRDDWLLNVSNGTIDLRTGERYDHRREDLLTRVAPVEYDAAAVASLWRSCLMEWMQGDLELINYLQKLAGYWLTGDIAHQILPIFWGEGANGKSTFLDTIAAIMGPYAGIAPPNLLIAEPTTQHPTELADLWGKRFVIASETEEGRALKIALVKQLTGDSTIKGRFMRQDFFEFRRTHKLVLATNHRPRVSDATNAAWRRLKLVPWSVIIPQDRQDKSLMARLRAESSGVLNWALEGLAWLQEDGLVDPPSVRDATVDYRAGENPLQDFLDERCRVARGEWASSSDLYTHYTSYCHQIGDKFPLSRRKFSDRLVLIPGVILEQRKTQGHAVRVFTGVSMRN